MAKRKNGEGCYGTKTIHGDLYKFYKFPDGHYVYAKKGPKLRALVGPHDPDVAKAIRPNTIRALFGKDRVYNAVHCTDLVEDGPLEVDYLFNKLSHYGH